MRCLKHSSRRRCRHLLMYHKMRTLGGCYAVQCGLIIICMLSRALADLVRSSALELNKKEKEDEKVHVDQGAAIKTISLAALPNDCRCALVCTLRSAWVLWACLR